jgi:hypothetical protein
MFGNITDLITENSNNVDTISNFKRIVQNFNKIPMPSTLQYIKLVNDLNEVLGIGEENET